MLMRMSGDASLGDIGNDVDGLELIVAAYGKGLDNLNLTSVGPKEKK